MCLYSHFKEKNSIGGRSLDMDKCVQAKERTEA